MRELIFKFQNLLSIPARPKLSSFRTSGTSAPHTYIHIQTVILVCIFTSICTYITDDIKIAHMPYAHLISYTDGYDHDTDIYEHLHMSAYAPICAYISMYHLLLAIHMCLYV